MIKSFNYRLKLHNTNSSIFSIFCLLTLAFPYYMWSGDSYLQYNTLVLLKYICSLLCCVLLTHNYWPAPLGKYYNLYWFITLTFCLPFTSVIILLYSGITLVSAINFSFALLLLFLLSEWRIFLLSFVIGGLAALSLSLVQMIPIGPILTTYEAYSLLGGCLLLLLTCTCFIARKRKETDKNLIYVNTFGKLITHEAKTPLIGAEMGLKYLLNSLDRADVPTVDSITRELRNMTTEIKRSAEKGQRLHEMLLTNTSEMDDCSKQACGAIDIVNETLSTFALTPQDRALFTVVVREDFVFWANRPLILNVLSHLIKNKLMHAGSAKAEIIIEYGQITLRNFGPALERGHLKKLIKDITDDTFIEPYLGLRFCKEVMRYHITNGDIILRSYGEVRFEVVLAFCKAALVGDELAFLSE